MTRESLGYRIYIVFYFILTYILIILFNDLPRVLFRRRKNINEQVVVVTGGAMGIGKSVSQRLAIEQNAKICILDVNEIDGQKTADEICEKGGIAKFFKCDISNCKQLEDVANQIRNDPVFGFVNIVIANAAILKFGTVLEMSNDDYKLNSDINYLGHIFTIKTFLEQMFDKRQGHIVSIGSICGHFGESSGSAYCSAKFAARGFLESLHAEIFEAGLEKNIHITSIYPYFVNTHLLANLQEPHSTFWDVIPLDVISEEIVDSILYNKYCHFIPASIKILCVYMKWMVTLGTLPLGKKVFNVKCKQIKIAEKEI